MKITIFGLTITSSWGNGHATPYRALLKALHRRGHRVAFYERDTGYYRLRRDFEHAEYCDVVLYQSWQAVRQRALAEAASSDVVINASYCPEGSRIADEVLELPEPLHVFYDLDTPITLQQMERGADPEYLRSDQIPAFELYLSFTAGGILDELEKVYGARRAEALYGCVDPEVHRPMALHNEFRCALSYVGTYAADRQQKLDQLFLEPSRRSPERTFFLAGSLYPWHWQWPENVRRMEHVAPAKHAALYCSSQATLNITRAGMARWGWCPSGRFFEAAACGTPVISDYFPGLETFFTPGEEIVIARSCDDVLAALGAPAMLAQMAQRARVRTLDEHTGEKRAEQLLDYLSERGTARKQSRPAEVAW